MTLPTEGVPCVCTARDDLHIHLAEGVFALTIDSNAPRGTLLFGTPEQMTPVMSVDAAMATSWGMTDTEIEALDQARERGDLS